MEVSKPCQDMQAVSAPSFDSPTLMHSRALQEELLRTLGMQGAGFNGTIGSDLRTLVLSSPFTKLSHHSGRLTFPYCETDITISSHRHLVYHPFPLLSGINRSHPLSPCPAFRYTYTYNLERRFFFCLAKLFILLSVLLGLSGMLSKMIKLSALWATLFLVRVTMQMPLPDSGYTGVDCDMAKKIKYTNLVGKVIVSPPHLVSGSSCTSYQGTRNLFAQNFS